MKEPYISLLNVLLLNQLIKEFLYSHDADTCFLWRGIFESVSVTSYHAVRARLEWTKIFRNLTKMDARDYLPVSRTKKFLDGIGQYFLHFSLKKFENNLHTYIFMVNALND